jgi:IclR family pca regulon transcriptional regulator
LLAAKSDDEAIALLRKMDRKAFTKATRTSLSSLMEQIRNVREIGFATVEEELEVGLLSIAVPIMNRYGRVTQCQFERDAHQTGRIL